MIDWHSHILPKMDDGSRDVAESISMINALWAQGADTVIATPHFIANSESVASFLQRRQAALQKLQAALPADAPTVRLGAEVKYYQGISRLEDLKALRIENTKLLLLEMPMAKWTESVVRELIELSVKSDLQLILAHVERYWGLQNAAVWERLLDNGIILQVNASFFKSMLSKQKAMALLKAGYVHLIGTDCHNMTSRAPQLAKAYETIAKKLGNNFVNQMHEYGAALLDT